MGRHWFHSFFRYFGTILSALFDSETTAVESRFSLSIGKALQECPAEVASHLFERAVLPRIPLAMDLSGSWISLHKSAQASVAYSTSDERPTA